MNILLLQGPLGPFFRQLAAQFQAQSHHTHRIHLNGGDRFYSGIGQCSDYRGTQDQWPDFIHAYLRQHHIDMLVVYGDCRFYHRHALQQAKALNILCIVLEEGYLRPDWITCEQDGANAYSRLLQRFPLQQTRPDNIVSTSDNLIGNTLFRRIVYASCYYWAMALQRRQFPDYQHHIDSSPWQQGLRWLLGYIRKVRYRQRDRQSLQKVLDQQTPFFLFPLQVSSDAQILFHSDFRSMEAIIRHVVQSFAAHAPSSHKLLIKHHPQNRGHNHYGQLIHELAQQYQLQDRLCYGHDWHLPTLLRHCGGVVTLNSTVGISALIHHLPVKVIGRAFWDIAGVTDQQPLDNFWQQPGQPDADTIDKLLTLIKHHTQLRGSFYKRADYLAGQLAQQLIKIAKNS